MLDLVLLGLLPGLVLGLRFRVAVLLPVSLIGGLNILAIGLLLGESLQTALWTAIVPCVALAVGYVVGSLIGMLPVVERRLRAKRPVLSDATPMAAPPGFVRSVVGRLSSKK
ncbi:hypothetical protein [Rhodopseudomonas telluris]|uniref:Uncharacterized protein n=1 Tax=Rhodopseudomonas telluris TaxID=644215 RepID=A0ABV6EVX5_9BRAD